jgi:hypothetical protein
MFKYVRRNGLFLFTVGIILVVTGMAKIVTAFGSIKILNVRDPLFGLPFRSLLLLVGLVELVIACLCLFRKCPRLNTVLVSWLATNFVAYRFGLWFVGWKRPCPCLGNLTDMLHISPQTADTALRIILAYLLIGSYVKLFWLWRQRKMAHSASLSAQ